jgi:hypothetical protein
VTIYHTTDGSPPTTASTVYSGPIAVSTNTTINAIAVVTGLSNSAVVSGTYTIMIPQAATPTFSPAPGVFTSAQNVTLSDATPGAAIYYTTDGSPPTTASTVYSGPIAVSTTTTIKAIAGGSGMSNSAVASGTYTISKAVAVNYGSGFSATGLQFNGHNIKPQIIGTRLRLTDLGVWEAASVFYTTPVNIQNFATDFSFQLTNAKAEGITFTIQSMGLTALGRSAGDLGYGSGNPSIPGIRNSVAVKFDITNSAGEGIDSTGLYLNGVDPTVPAKNMSASGVSLLSGDVFNVHMAYDGTTLQMTITDATAPSKTFSTSWPVNIPAAVGGNTAYVGFTGATGSLSAIQEIINWTYNTQ